MSRHCRSAAVLGVLIVLAGATLAGCSSSSSGIPGTGSVGAAAQTAPDFSGITLDGLEVSLSEYRGKPVILAFMASW